MKKVEFSSHALFDREERIVWIATEVGFGQVVDTIQIYDVERNYRRIELTETGVAIIKAVEEEFVITSKKDKFKIYALEFILLAILSFTLFVSNIYKIFYQLLPHFFSA